MRKDKYVKKKLWAVTKTVRVRFEMGVSADSAEEAEKLAAESEIYDHIEVLGTIRDWKAKPFPKQVVQPLRTGKKSDKQSLHSDT